MLRAHPEWDGAVFLIGADEFVGFLGWKEPDEVLAPGRGSASRRAPATRASASRPSLDALAAPGAGARSSSSSRCRSPRASCASRLDRGEDVHAFVPAAVWALIERDGLYGRAGYTERG